MSATTLAVELLIAAAVLWLLLGPASLIRLQRRMAYWLGLVTDEEPTLVCDRTGNLWHRYNDVGYVQLVTISRAKRRAEPTLEALEAAVGPVVEWGPM